MKIRERIKLAGHFLELIGCEINFAVGNYSLTQIPDPLAKQIGENRGNGISMEKKEIYLNLAEVYHQLGNVKKEEVYRNKANSLSGKLLDYQI